MRSNARTGAFGSFAETFDFGFVEPLAIGDKLFIDLNGDGAQNDGGGGVSGVTVRLLRGSTELATQVTDSNGSYVFSERTVPGLVPSTTYSVEVARAAGAEQCCGGARQPGRRRRARLGSGARRRPAARERDHGAGRRDAAL